MFSHFVSLGKKLVVLTLLAGILVMPVSPLLAEEMADVQVSSPVVVEEQQPAESLEATTAPDVVQVDTIASDQTPVCDEPITTDLPVEPIVEPIDMVASSTLEVSTIDTPVIAPVAVTDSAVQIVTDIESVKDNMTEDSFTTLGGETESDFDDSEESNFETLPATSDEDWDNLAISDENPFGEEPNWDNLAISAEQNGETTNNETDNPWAESAENSFSTLSLPVDTEATSPENSFTTVSVAIDTLTVSDEGMFTTLTSPIVDNLTTSAEQSFTTAEIPPIDTLAISAENSFNTLPDEPITDPVVSDENSFTTAEIPPIDTLAVSDELSFTTLTSPTIDTLSVSDELSFNTLSQPADNLAVSDENSFTTLTSPTIVDPAVSDENSFTTLDNPVNPPVNPPSSGGPSSSSSGRIILPTPTYTCPIFLKKFIKFGQANDRFEVIKLQAFLKVFEGFDDLKITGVYDRATYRAVEIFQARYLRDVLRPWGITDSTGYVYITTRLTINKIYCGQDTRNNLDLRYRVAQEYRQATGDNLETSTTEPDNLDGGYYLFPTTTATTTASVVRPSVFLAGVGELLNFIGDNFCWLLNLFLLFLIFFLLWLLWQTSREDGEESGNQNLGQMIKSEETHLPIGTVALEDLNDDVYPVNEEELISEKTVTLPEEILAPIGEDSEVILGAEDEEELAKLAEEDEEKLEVLDNNPWQESLT